MIQQNFIDKVVIQFQFVLRRRVHALLRACEKIILRFTPAKIHQPEEDDLAVVAPNAPLRRLSSRELDSLNRSLPWETVTLDHLGRAVGRAQRLRKRRDPESFTDWRIAKLDDLVGLNGKRVTELGCLEGKHSIILSSLGADVLGVDVRPVNLAKSHLRASLYGHQISTYLCDLDNLEFLEADGVKNLLSCDVLVHIGVLYHLTNPSEHLRQMVRLSRKAILLDTHVSDRPIAVNEFGFTDIYSGISPKSLWITLKEIAEILEESDFECVLLDKRQELNGDRITIVAQRR